MAGSNPGTALLAGTRVVDFSTARAAMCGRVLADLGAEVIRVEPPGGSPARRLPPFAGPHDSEPGLSLFWLSVSLGTKSVVLDLEDHADLDRLRALIASADVLVESFDPGHLAGCGLDYASLSATQPSLIYVSVTPYGQDGPDAGSPATDLTLQAAGGLVALQGDPDRPPVPVGGAPQAYFHAGAQAAADTVIALHERERSGLGQHLDVSIQAGVVWTLMNATGYPPNTGANYPGTCETRHIPYEPLPGLHIPTVWACRDGHFGINISLPAIGWRTLHAIAGWAEEEGALPAPLCGRDWSSWVADVLAGTTTVDEILQLISAAQQFLLTKAKREIQAFALATGTIIGPVYTIEDIVNDPQLAARGYFREIAGRQHPGAFVQAARAAVGPFAAAPRLGEHQSLTGEVSPLAAFRPASQAQRERAFTGLKVADFSWVGVGPMIAKALADHGATVVRVESGSRPDILRLLPPFKDRQPGINRSQFWAFVNTSKLSLGLDLSTAEGRDLAHRLVDWADVVVESFTPGTMRKWGLDYESLAAKRPDLVMLSTCLRGQAGPEAKFTGFGGQGAALAGIHLITGWPDRPPSGPWGAYTDFINPRLGVAALAAALLRRFRTGEGEYLDLAQTEAGSRFIEPEILDFTVNRKAPARMGARSAYASPNGVFQCAEGRFVAISVESAEHWQRLVAAMCLDRFADASFELVEARRASEDAIEAAIGAWCDSRDASEAAAWLKTRGVPAAAVTWPSELYEDAQLTHRSYFVTLDHGEMGPTPYDGLVTRFSATPGELRAGPCLGEHTEYVLAQLLGLAQDEIEALAVAGALT